MLCCAGGCWAEQSRAASPSPCWGCHPLLSLVSPCAGHQARGACLGWGTLPFQLELTGPELQSVCPGAAAGTRAPACSALVLPGSPARRALSPQLLSKPLAAAVPVHPCSATVGPCPPSPPSHSPLLPPAPNPAVGDSCNHSLQHVQLLLANDD